MYPLFIAHGSVAPTLGTAYQNALWFDTALQVLNYYNGSAWVPLAPAVNAGWVLPTRLINTTAPLTGGGDLSADRTLVVSAATTTAAGVVELATDGEAIADRAVQGNDARLADARTPTDHAASHASGGSDAVKLDDLAATDDNTDLNASTVKHGLFPKLPGGTSNFWREDGTWQPQAAGAVNVKQTEIDFGAMPVAEASFVVVDASVTPSSQIIGSIAYEAPTGKDLDELEMDGLDLKFGPGSGQFTLYARGQDGYVADTFKVNYVIG